MRSLSRSVALAVVLLLAVAPAAWAASPQITFYFGLSRPEAAARAAFFTVQRPGSSTYRRFLSPRGVAARYGASTAVRGRFLRVIRGYGFSARVDASGVFARVSGSVARFQRVFRVSIRHFSGDEPPVNAYVAKRTLRLPATLAPLVKDVVTSFARQIRVSSGSVGAARAVPGQAAGRGPRRTGTWAHGCAEAKATGAFSYAQVRHAYGVDRLGAGAGASVAILGLQEAPSARDIADNAHCFGYGRLRSHTILTDGQIFPISPGDDFEPQLDSAVARGMAPSTSLTFTQAVSGADQWFLGASQILDARTLPDSFSISYGICESDPVNGPYANSSNRSGADLLDSLLVRLGLAGVGSYASAGDGGSSCNGAIGPSGRPLRGIAWPGSSPYLTSVGGTRLTLTSANQRRDEVVWNDLQWRSRANGGGAGGGGLSLFAPRPPFQAGLGLPGHSRAVPDVAAAASNFPGWPIVDGGTWLVDGGTSAAAPLVASAMAAISAQLRSRHLPPIGPADGLLYYLGRHQPGAMWDVIHGSNGFLPRIPPRRARRGYDLASGLGVPQFARVARSLPSPAPIRRRTSGLG